MSILAVLAPVVLTLSGLLPWWFAGRLSIPARERLPLDELGLHGVLGTLRRGADWYVPQYWRSDPAPALRS